MLHTNCWFWFPKEGDREELGWELGKQSGKVRFKGGQWTRSSGQDRNQGPRQNLRPLRQYFGRGERVSKDAVNIKEQI